jgi:hypothetical protein
MVIASLVVVAELKGDALARSQESWNRLARGIARLQAEGVPTWWLAGKSADFVVLDADPIDDVTNTRKISHVVLRGVEIDRLRLRAGFVNRDAPHSDLTWRRTH